MHISNKYVIFILYFRTFTVYMHYFSILFAYICLQNSVFMQIMNLIIKQKNNKVFEINFSPLFKQKNFPYFLSTFVNFGWVDTLQEKVILNKLHIKNI